MVGYHHYCDINWFDAYVNAAMILSGMGPVDVAKTNAGKIFVGSYAIFSGIVFLSVMAILLMPVINHYIVSIREKIIKEKDAIKNK